LSTNYPFYDLHVDNVPLGVKRLVNADGAQIPEGPTGKTFDGTTHTHYQARASSLANSDVDALIEDVTEHGHTNGIKLVINLANVPSIAGLTKFTPGQGPFVIPPLDDPRTVTNLDVNAPADNRLIGYWD